MIRRVEVTSASGERRIFEADTYGLNQFGGVTVVRKGSLADTPDTVIATYAPGAWAAVVILDPEPAVV